MTMVEPMYFHRRRAGAPEPADYAESWADQDTPSFTHDSLNQNPAYYLAAVITLDSVQKPTADARCQVVYSIRTNDQSANIATNEQIYTHLVQRDVRISSLSVLNWTPPANTNSVPSVSDWFSSFTSLRRYDLESEFRGLASKWRRDTLHLSSLTDIFMDESYQRIMAMGPAALPLIFKELQRSPGHWFYALEYIVGEYGKDVAKGALNYKAARAMWLAWARQNHYL